MKLSIIIPLYNAENYVRTCIESILNQGIDSNEFEILIINDGSTDNSLKIVKKFEQKYHNVFVFTKKNEGVGSARNEGIRLAKGKYIYFLDPDDYLANNVLDLILFSAEKNKLQVLAFSSISTTKTDLNKSLTINAEEVKLQITNGIEYIAFNGYKNEVWWYIIERTYLKELGLKFIEGRWMEDAIFTPNLLIKAQRISKLQIDVHRHVKVQGSAMTSKEPNHYIRVIYDNANAAKELGNLIQEVKESKNANSDCIRRLRARQESFVFFLMIRILKSKITFKEVKQIIQDMTKIRAYPLYKFLGKDYNGFTYQVLTNIFNFKIMYLLIFLISNPFLRYKN